MYLLRNSVRIEDSLMVHKEEKNGLQNLEDPVKISTVPCFGIINLVVKGIFLEISLIPHNVINNGNRQHLKIHCFLIMFMHQTDNGLMIMDLIILIIINLMFLTAIFLMKYRTSLLVILV